MQFTMYSHRGALVLIDGAHSLGQTEVNIDSYGADFYVVNCHKWLCNTRGSAIAHVNKDVQSLVKPLTVSFGHRKGFAAEFGWLGNVSFTADFFLLIFLCCPYILIET